jgi:hypothetical protein
MTNHDETPFEDETIDETPKTPFEEFLYHQRRALEETGRALEALLPEGFRKHGSNASKEFTKGFKVLVDAALEELNKAQESKAQAEAEEQDDKPNPPTSSTGKNKVRIDVD